MVKSNYDFRLAHDSLANGTLTIDQALAIFQTDPEGAYQLLWESLRVAFQDPMLVSTTTLEGPIGKMLRVLWKLRGPGVGFDTLMAFQHPLIDALFQDKLDRTPTSFTDADLTRLAEYYRDKPLGKSVATVRGSRLAAVADELRKNPTELSLDVVEVKRRVSEYCFNPDLNELLDKVGEGLIADGDPFDQAALLKHLRTFFERLHELTGKELRARRPETIDGTDLTKCGQAIDYLEQKDVLTDKMRALGRALYGVLSNEGVHAIKSDREYTRLCRNMVAEYALVLFFELERRLKK